MGVYDDETLEYAIDCRGRRCFRDGGSPRRLREQRQHRRRILARVTNGVLTVTTGSAGTFADNFSPFSPTHEDPAWGMIYEPLFFFDTAKSGDVKPWLGTSYAWSNGGKTVTVQLQHNVTWTDGKPFTSADVVFTFDQALHSAALNIYGIPLASVSADGTYAVTINFTKPAYSDAYYALGRELDPAEAHLAVDQRHRPRT